MAEVTQQQVIDYIKGISVIELSQSTNDGCVVLAECHAGDSLIA